jgi:hypothetical protein
LGRLATARRGGLIGPRREEHMRNSTLLMRFTWSLSAIIMLVGVIVIAVSLWLAPAGHWIRDLFLEIGIAGVSAGIIGFVYEHLLRRELLDQVKSELSDIVDTDARRLGIAEIYETRTKKADRVKLPLVIREANTDIVFVGLGLYTIINEHRTYLEEAIARGCNLRFLIFDVNSPDARVLDASLGAGELVSSLSGSFSAVQAFAQRHAASGKVAVRVFDIVPTFGAVAVDRGEADGRLFVELNCYASSGDQCPGFKLERKQNGLFYTYDRQITALWSNAKPIAVKALAASGDAAPAAATA